MKKHLAQKLTSLKSKPYEQVIIKTDTINQEF